MWLKCPVCGLIQQPPANAPARCNCGQPLSAPTQPPPPPPALPTEPPWYYARDGQTIGPVPFDDLREFARRGTLKPTDHVLQHGTSNWVAAGSLPALFPHQPPPPPPPQAFPTVAPMGEVPCEVIPEPRRDHAPAAVGPGEPRLEPYLPFGARIRSDGVKRYILWTALAGPGVLLVGLIFLIGALQGKAPTTNAPKQKKAELEKQLTEYNTAIEKAKREGMPAESIDELETKRATLHDQIIAMDKEIANPSIRPSTRGAWAMFCALWTVPFLLPAGIVALLVGWRRRLQASETAYGLEWARYLDRARRLSDDWAGVRVPDSADHLHTLVHKSVAPEPPALYMGFREVKPRTWTIPPGASKALATDYLKFLIFRNLLALDLPESAVGWTTFEKEWMGLLRMDVDEHTKIEACFTVRTEGNVLSLFWNCHTTWLYPEELGAFWADTSYGADRVPYLIKGTSAYQDVRWGHTGVWFRVNLFRIESPRGTEDDPILNAQGCSFTFRGLHRTMQARTEALAAKINAEIEAAMAEFTPVPEFRPSASPPSSHRPPTPQW